MSLFPKDEVFYHLFERQAQKLNEASGLLADILSNPQKIEEFSLKMKKIEEEADALGHSVIDNLIRSFITPIESEDIDILRQKLDDIMDCIEKATNRMVIYKIKTPFPSEIKEYIKIIRQAINEIDKGIKEIRNVRKFQSELHLRCEKLNELENVGDAVNRTALKNLMSVPDAEAKKIVEIIKLKEIYETFENAIDFCEDVGNIFESILIKNR